MDYIPSNTYRKPNSFFDTLPAPAVRLEGVDVVLDAPILRPLPLARVLPAVDAIQVGFGETPFVFDLYHDYLVPLRAAREG